ncbi:MAG: cysteine hydrolase [Chloroflexi bacterium]|nr:cysteine hydrolase [Chloroflexota bacterium]
MIIYGKEVLDSLDQLVNPKHTALLLVDIQNDLVSPGGFEDKQGYDLSACRGIVPRVRRVLETARNKGVMVVHTQMTYFRQPVVDSPVLLRARLIRFGRPKGETGKLHSLCIENTWGWQIVDELAPLQNEMVVKKNRFSAFHGTNLDIILRSNGIKTVVIAGVVTNGCVLAAVVDARALDYYPVILRDCVASDKRELHEASLVIMSYSYDVVDSKEVINLWQSGGDNRVKTHKRATARKSV